MRYDVICQRCRVKSEIVKPMAAELPKCSECGGPLRRTFTRMPAVHYNAPDFYATDVSRFEKLVGTERAAKFNKLRDDAEKRKKQGQLTPYEKVLERI